MRNPAQTLLPSILSADFAFLGRQLTELETAGIEAIHIDIMDGCFVPNISLGFPVVSSIRPRTAMQFDVHLMVQEPERFIDMAVRSGADAITVHAEACRHLDRTLAAIRESGCRAGVALNPATSLEALRYVMDKLDIILLMTVNPGFGGQRFIPVMREKIRECRKLCEASGYHPLIQLDGGVTIRNAAQCLRDGADRLVAGSAVFDGSIAANVEALSKAIAI